MRIVLSILLSVTVLASLAAGSSQMFPERLRHGEVFGHALMKESLHHAKLRYVPNVTASWFDQLIDHDTPSLGTFKDKYYYDLSMWNKTTGLCMMYLNGEGPLRSSVTGYMAELAQDFGACTVAIEHRWYGESLPDSLTNKALMKKTLTIHNAMEDIISLMEYFERNIAGRKLTWFLVGGSYSGAMTIWTNVIHRGQFKASWAASGVLNPHFTFWQFDHHVASVVSDDCKKAIQNAMSILSKHWNDPSWYSKMQSLFNFPTYNTKEDVLWGLADASAMAVQYGAKYGMCNSILPVPEDPMEALQIYAEMIHRLWGPDFLKSCYYSTVCLSNSSMSHLWAPGGYSWVFQCCSEVAFWQIGYPDSIRSEDLTISYFMNQCQAMVYEDTIPNTWAFNRKYGGFHPATDGYIVATQGSDDPWITAGLRASPGPNFPVDTAQCDNCGHCGSMSSPHPSDQAPLVAQRKLVKESLSKWLAR